MHCFVGHFHVQRAGIRIGVNRDRLDPQSLGTLDNPAGNFAAIGDEDLNTFIHPFEFYVCQNSAETVPGNGNNKHMHCHVDNRE
jgi:hypothetical protein